VICKLPILFFGEYGFAIIDYDQEEWEFELETSKKMLINDIMN